MKRIFTSMIFIVAMSMSVDSQIVKGDYAVSINGNYGKGFSSSGVSTNNFSIKGETLNASIAIEHYKKSKSYIGFGIDLHWSDDLISNTILSKTFTQYEDMNVKSMLIFPHLICGQYMQIANDLFFNMSVRVGLGRLTYESTSDYKNFQHNIGGTLTLTTNPNEDLSWDASDAFLEFGTSLTPEINYFISERLGLSLYLGDIGISILDFDKSQTSFNVNFNPNNWKLGIKYIL
jgi:hypothetical protein